MRRAAEELYRAAGVPVETSFSTKRIERTPTPRGQVAKTRKPKSVYDKLDPSLRPFGWSSPAPGWDGTTPLPWRVTNREAAEKLVQQGGKFPEFYVTRGDDHYGRLVWEIGFRETKDREEWLRVAARGLHNEGFVVLFESGVYRLRLRLIDDLPKNVLKSRRR
jgi:hypothetical protein